MAFKDHFSAQSDRYRQYRPRYPRELFSLLAKLPVRSEVAWDCGTGSGQAAVGLADFVGCVVATDPSRQQVTHAEQSEGVFYLTSTAEHAPLAGASVDLITVAQAVHWFDLPVFLQETRRVGRAGSVLAIWSYALAQISPQIDAVVARLYHDILGEYWPAERKLVENGYRDIDLEMPEIELLPVTMTAHWSLDNWLGYLGTWSSVQRYRARHQTDPIALVRDPLRLAWGAGHLVREVSWPLVIRAARIHPV